MGQVTDRSAQAPVPREAYAADLSRFSHGDFDITVFSDGFITLTAEIILPDAPPDERPAILRRLGGDAESAPYQVNIPLIRAGNDLILVDNGSGDKFQASAGKLAANLKAAGVDPASITKVVFTHIHPDHAGGTILPDGTLLCPNAHYYVNDAEWRFWTDPNYETTMPATLHDFARGSQRDMAAVQDRLTRFKPGDEIVSGMRVLETRGHTPGHVSFELAGGDGLIINGDVSTSNILFFEHPNWHFGFDTEPEIALKTRQAFLDRVANEKTKMLGYHWVYPGVGYAERKGTAYQFVAA
ncbi:MBL fold metallo-hydrolase [Microvirga sesbaniae]|uniref:MBL fold metallo-hydrolase n=1 Tax=Microvirga sesbaniae TaxID=681392 RepID=UPI0021C9CA5B|nr:MBL fold metallo-hydrolase [Microvirga sp. HBU67692]